MYLSPQTARLKNLLVSLTSGSITLIILLIAPLGLAAVIANTVLVTLAVYTCAQTADRTLYWLRPYSKFNQFSAHSAPVHQQTRQPALRRWRK